MPEGHFQNLKILAQSRISFFVIHRIVAQLWIIWNLSTIVVNWIRLHSDFASSCRGHYNRINCNDNWWWSVFAKKEAKSLRSSGAVPKIRRQSIHSDTMSQIKHNSRWLGQDWRIFAIKIQFGQIVSTSVDLLILNQIRWCFGLQQRAKSGRPTKLQQLRTAKAKSFAMLQIVEELQNWP